MLMWDKTKAGYSRNLPYIDKNAEIVKKKKILKPLNHHSLTKHLFFLSNTVRTSQRTV
jgi:hypothetical protein